MASAYARGIASSPILASYASAPTAFRLPPVGYRSAFSGLGQID